MENRPRVTEGVQRLRGLFLEVPGTCLTLTDVSKLSGLEGPECEAVLGALEDAHFLRRRHDGRYQRWTLDSAHS
jgi:DNA-binding IclR family transcriptional regulator